MSRRYQLQDGTGILATLDNGDIIMHTGITVPADSAAGYATGCLFLHTDGGAGTALYVNVGSNTSCNFDAVA